MFLYFKKLIFSIFSIIIIPIIIFFLKKMISTPISLSPSNYTQNIISTPIVPSNINRKLRISVFPGRSKYTKHPIQPIKSDIKPILWMPALSDPIPPIKHIFKK
jgi:hypothetical protein